MFPLQCLRVRRAARERGPAKTASHPVGDSRGSSHTTNELVGLGGEARIARLTLGGRRLTLANDDDDATMKVNEEKDTQVRKDVCTFHPVMHIPPPWQKDPLNSISNLPLAGSPLKGADGCHVGTDLLLMCAHTNSLQKSVST